MTGNGQHRFSDGSRILHPELGAGLVRRLRRGGRTLMVNFDSNPRLLLEVKGHEVTLEPGTLVADSEEPVQANQVPGADPEIETSPVPVPVGQAEPFRRFVAGADDDPESREALRLGVVPHADLRASSVGRDHELQLVRQDLAETAGGGSARVFLGDYGTGKTHMLEIIEREALAAGFLVGRVTMDAQYVMPNHPMRIYREVVTTLTYPDRHSASEVGLEPLLRKAVADDKLLAEVAAGKTGLGRHLYLRPALSYFHALADLDDPLPRDLIVDWISGQRSQGNQELDLVLRALARILGSLRGGPRIYSMKDFQPWAHVYSFLLGGIAVLARRTGYRGLVVLLDEAENYDLLGSGARAFADSVFSCLVLAGLGTERVLFSESNIDKGGFPPQKRLPFIFEKGQSLYFVSAMTPSTAGEDLLRRLIPEDRVTELTPLYNEHYLELSRRVAGIYERAHPEMRLTERLSRPLGDVLWTLIDQNHIASPREATKLTVEFLDLLRLRRDAVATFLADVKRALK